MALAALPVPRLDDARRGEILRVLVDASASSGPGARIRWRTEWLGWLPFGQYQWVEVEREGGTDSLSRLLPDGWSLEDLQALAAAGHLRQVSEAREEESDMHEIVYELTEAG